METEYNLEDYKDLYQERSKAIEESGMTKGIAQCKAFDEVFNIFIRSEAPCDEEIKLFRRKVK